MAEKNEGGPKRHLEIPLARIRDEIRKHIEPVLEKNGFERLGDRRWVRRTKEPIREVVYLFFLKGYTHVHAGIVLAGAPVLNGKRISVPKAPEANAFPVWLPPMKANELKAPFCAFPTQSEFKAKIAAYAPKMLELELKRFSRVTSLEDLRKVLKSASASALEKKTHPLRREGTLAHGLTYIFTLSMLGQLSAARSELAVWCKHALAAPDQRKKLSALIELSASVAPHKEVGRAQKVSRRSHC